MKKFISEKKKILERLAIELMRHENAKAEIFNDSERFTKFETYEDISDENNVSCSKIIISSQEGIIKEYTYYL